MYVCVNVDEVIWSNGILRVLGKQFASNNKKPRKLFPPTWRGEKKKKMLKEKHGSNC